MIKKIQQDAEKLLTEGKVDCIIGYGYTPDEKHIVPIIIKDKTEISQLVFTPQCFNNLAVYLKHPEIKKMTGIGIVSKENDMKSLVVLAQESQIDPDTVSILGVQLRDKKKTEAGWKYLGVMDFYHMLNYINLHCSNLEISNEASRLLQELKRMSHKQRWDYWQQEFSKCIRCNACRQICPLCFCNPCIANKNQPQWISTNIDKKGKFAWNIIRAFHLAGRCTGCSECERACPMGMPIMTLNQFLAQSVFETFGYRPGLSIEDKPFFTFFNDDDPDVFISRHKDEIH